MALYSYQAIGPDGATQDGSLEAFSEAQAIESLNAQGLMPLKILLGGDAEAGVSNTEKKPQQRSLFGPRNIKQDDIIGFTQQLSSMLKAGLPLDRALGIQLEVVDNPALEAMINNVQEKVRGGMHFADALEDSKQFSRFYVNMVRAGEASGSIGDAMERLVEYMLRAKELRGTVVSALIYPAILFGVAIISIVALLLFVVPKFSEMFADMGAELPTLTKVVIAAGAFMENWWWAVLCGFLVLLVLIRYLFTNETARLWLDRSMLSWPLVGDLLGKVEMARFSRSLGTLLNNGVPLLGSLQIVKNTMSNRVMAKSVGEAADSLKQGESLTKTLLSKKVFPAYALHMLRVGEETGRMEELLNDVAVIYDDEVKTSVRQMLALMEPLLILIMAVAILAILFAVLIPMISMGDLVQ